MKKVIYITLAICLISTGVVTAKNLIATDHDHDHDHDHNTATSATVIDHSGRTNQDGCHNDRKRGTYHCH